MVGARFVAGVWQRRYALFPSIVALCLTLLTLVIIIFPYLSFTGHRDGVHDPVV